MAKKQTKKKKSKLLFVHIFLFITMVLCLSALFLFVFAPKPIFTNLLDYSKYSTSQPISYEWDSDGSIAIGTTEWGVKFSAGDDQLHPIASTAKIITALTVLNKLGEKVDDPNETVTITSQDVSFYDVEVKRGGTNLPVKLGQKISAKNLLTGMMLASANNFANTLALHYFGGLQEYRSAAQQFLLDNNLLITQLGKDASGLDEGTQSTAKEMVKIGILAMQNETLKKITSLKSWTIPEVGTFSNTNVLLDENGFVGVKTGTTPKAGACLISAYERNYNGKSIIFVVAILGDTSEKRFYDAKRISHEFADAVFLDKIIRKGDVIGEFNYANSRKEWMTADQDVEVLHFIDSPIYINFKRDSSKSGVIINTDNNQIIGRATFPTSLKNTQFCTEKHNNLERLKVAIFTPQCSH